MLDFYKDGVLTDRQLLKILIFVLQYGIIILKNAFSK